MMLWHNIFQTALLAYSSTRSSALAVGGGREIVVHPYRNAPLQNLVTWDSQSLYVRGQRILFYSGEFHPFRLPVPSLWLDVFQKIKALGYNGVSFYTDWALLEGKPGNFTAEGIFALEPFFDAAKAAGIYLLARPGPYVNAEVSGGGFPGWLQRDPARLRTRDPGYLNATTNYVTQITRIIARAQITNGGPVILLQPENEYTYASAANPEFPDAVYFQYVQDQYRDNGIVVPLISNDAAPDGYFAPGPPRKQAAVDIYGHDGYPLGFDCGNPYVWPANALPTNYGALHENQSSSTPYSIIEFQAGSFDPWGGPGFNKCLALIGPEFERVFYKNDFSFGVKIFNLYMTYGGTNWGNLGHPGGYTSYDYAAVIAEDRTVAREKYSEAKLLANFLQASPAYLTAIPQNNQDRAGAYTGNNALAATALIGNSTKFFVVRHSDYQSFDLTSYKITLPTSKGNLTIPQLGGSLSLNGRDSKIFVTDYNVGGVNLLYSTAEIFTWKKYGNRRVLVVYVGPGETNEFAVSCSGNAKTVEGNGVTITRKSGTVVVNFATSADRRVVRFDAGLDVHVLDRSSAYNYWVIDALQGFCGSQHALPTKSQSTPIIRAGYLIRNVTVSGQTMSIVGDLNATTPLEIIGGAPSKLQSLTFNGKKVDYSQDRHGVVSANLAYMEPSFNLPNLTTLEWKYIDSLPEISNSYDDSLWTSASLTYSNNTARNLTTPTSLYASDYGYHTGSLLYRGHFVAKGSESVLTLHTQGGLAFGHSAWLNETFLGSVIGNGNYADGNASYTLSSLSAGEHYVITVLVDNMGLDENYNAGGTTMKNPRGVLDYSLAGHPQSDVTWKLTGNLGGEDYRDHTRGPLNEGGLFAERQGYHLPGAPISSWKSVTGGPLQGLAAPGVAFYAAELSLDLPAGYDVPLSLVFGNDTSAAYRAQIFVNGYQFGKLVSNIGPQQSFPVPQGIWNYAGMNRVAVSLWALQAGGAKVSGLSLEAGHAVQSGYGHVALSPMTGWVERTGAY